MRLPRISLNTGAHSWDLLESWAPRQEPPTALTISSLPPLSSQDDNIMRSLQLFQNVMWLRTLAILPSETLNKHLDALICPRSDFTHQLLGQIYLLHFGRLLCWRLSTKPGIVWLSLWLPTLFSSLLLRETRWNLSLFWKHAHLFMLLPCGRPLCLSLNSSAQFYAYMSPTHCLQGRQTPMNLEARGPEPNVHHPLMASQANVPVSLPLGEERVFYRTIRVYRSKIGRGST